jgi:hypothetical protein
MKYIQLTLSVLALLSFTLLSTMATAQNNQPRASLHAQVTQTIGVDTDITIDFSRPGVKGREIWGELVPYGMAPGNRYSNNKPFPWRAGANENTTIEFNNDLMIEGESIPAGKYSIHMIPAEDEPWTVIFNKVNDAWGSFQYDESQDALRIKVDPVKAEYQEYLTYGFEDLSGNSATAYLHWAELKVPFTVEVASK